MTRFPSGFVWGVATAAYQIEGGATAEGRGRSVWDAFCDRPGAVVGGHRGDTACDHHRRFLEDVALMKSLGVRAYRFSIAWPRVMPGGDGPVNAAGLDFYSRLVDALLDAGIEPWATLFHWDYPEPLFQRGGWLHPDSPKWFEAYATACARALGDRVNAWFTINEPQIFIGHGHHLGRHAPGQRLARPEIAAAAHRVLHAHGLASRALRAQDAKARVGMASADSHALTLPASESPADIARARAATFATVDADDWMFNTAWYNDPIFFGRYPDDALPHAEPGLPTGWERDLDTIRSAPDFYGTNTYNAQPQAVRDRPAPVGGVWAVLPPGWPQTAIQWPVTPEALRWGPRFLHERYRVPVYVSENGLACTDWRHTDGRVHDEARVDFLRRHLVELRRGMEDGADVRGYFHWSLLDNFEWAEGYQMRFGLVHVNYQTGQRTPKASFGEYRGIIASHGATLPERPAPML